MGVHKLWDILLTVAHQKQIEDLSGLVLAIDASIWIVKINSIYQSVDEGLRCIFNKLVWLKKNNIKPIFVFDGDTPILKRKTLEQRRSRRKEPNSFDITKKVEIEIVKTLTGVHSNQKNEQKAAYHQKEKEIDQMMANLFKYQSPTNTLEISEKIALQAEVLNKKYELYCEMHPNLQRKFGNFQDFANLDIQSKEEILEQIKEYGLPATREQRKMKNQMSQQQKIMYEMQIIKKKSQIRELQDNLYRKLMNKKIENGFQIIQGVYNGKKVVQKRKIKQKPFNYWDLGGSKKERCNDFKQIFRKNKNEPSAEISGEEDAQPNNFFAKIFNKDYNNDKKNTTKSPLSQFGSRLSQISINSLKERDQVEKKEQKEEIVEIGFEYKSDEYSLEVEERQGQGPKNKISQNEDPDNFPDFIMVQSLDELCTSNHNLHLQNMLDIIGINYVVAPFEAEAQCAALQQMGLVDGVVTEDSDVFLFGARAVYRGLFQDNIKVYWMKRIEEKLLLSRQKLILLGLLLGSDYTEGVKGIGIVNAMQILKVHHDFESLKAFTNWARNADILQDSEENKTEHRLESAGSEDEVQFYKLHRKFKNYWHVHPSFPESHIYEAYMQPDVQAGREVEKKVEEVKKMEMEALRRLMEQKFKMVPLQIEMNMKLLGKEFERKQQTEITEFTGGGFARIASKRLQKAISLRSINN